MKKALTDIHATAGNESLFVNATAINETYEELQGDNNNLVTSMVGLLLSLIPATEEKLKKLLVAVVEDDGEESTLLTKIIRRCICFEKTVHVQKVSFCESGYSLVGNADPVGLLQVVKTLEECNHYWGPKALLKVHSDKQKLCIEFEWL